MDNQQQEHEEIQEIQNKVKNIDLQCEEHEHHHSHDQQQQQVDEDAQQCEQATGKWQKIQPPEATIPLFMVDFEQCDAKKCTGKKMQRFKLLTNIKDKKKKFRGIVLSAFGKKTISKQDLQTCQKHGICVIDCSWNRIQQTRQFRYKHQRKLPFVVAGNPVNFGKPYQLSCVEAMTTALVAVGYTPQAKYIISKFGWSDGFWKENPGLINYGECASMSQVEQQSKFNEEQISKGFQRQYQYPESSDQQEEIKKQKA